MLPVSQVLLFCALLLIATAAYQEPFCLFVTSSRLGMSNRGATAKDVRILRQSLERSQRRVKRELQEAHALKGEPIPVDEVELKGVIERCRACLANLEVLSMRINDDFQNFTECFFDLYDSPPPEDQAKYEEFAEMAMELPLERNALQARLDRLERELTDSSILGSVREIPPSNPQISAALRAAVADGEGSRSGSMAASQAVTVQNDEASVEEVQNAGGTSRDGTSNAHAHTPEASSGDVMQALMSMLQRNLHTNSTKSNSRLPKLEPPKFSGQYADWQAFWDKFEASVEKNSTLSDAERLSYLISSCKGDAAKLIRHIPITNDNYRKAVSMLKGAFGNPLLAIESIHSKICDLKSVGSADVRQLKEFYFEIEHQIGSLSVLNAEIESVPLITTILKKLPEDVIVAMERSKGVGQQWTTSLIRKALRDEVEIRETAVRRATGQDVFGNATDAMDTKNAVKESPLSTTESFAATDRIKGDQRRPVWQRRGSGLGHRGGFGSVGSRPSILERPGPMGSRSARPQTACAYCQGYHWSQSCRKYPSMSARKDFLVRAKRCFLCLGDGHNIRNCNRSSACYHCKRTNSHHTSICPEYFRQNSNPRDHAHMVKENYSVKGVNLRDLTVVDKEESGSLANDEKSIMKTAMIRLSNPKDPNKATTVRAFLDSGTSRTYLTIRTASKLKLDQTFVKTLAVQRHGPDDEPALLDTVRLANVDLAALNGDAVRITAAVSKNTMQRMNRRSVPECLLRNLPSHMRLADEPQVTNQVVEVDLMIGNDYYEDVLTGRRYSLGNGFYLVESIFGWIPSGRLTDEGVPDDLPQPVVSYLMLTETSRQKDDLRQLERESPCGVEDLWRLDAIGITDDPNPVSDDDAIELFNQSVRFEEGRYQVTWPWRHNAGELPTNFSLSLRRLQGLLARNRAQGRWDFLDRYDKIIKGQLEAGVIEVVAELETRNRVHYLAHHGVETPQKATTKLRVVYDASARESPERLCLNDCLHRGEVILEDLVVLLMRFRTHHIAICCDLEKAFLQVGLQRHERDVTRFLWVHDLHREPTADNLVTYRFRRVSFGVKSSPFLLGATILHHLKQIDSPVARKIEANTYVDNVMTGVGNIDDAIGFYRESKQIFSTAGMNLREFASNSEDLMTAIPAKDRVTDDEIKVLGLRWQRSVDAFSVRVPDCRSSEKITKRVVLAQLFKVFDPLGFTTPVTIRGRVLLQQITKEKFAWNADLSNRLKQSWQDLLRDLLELSALHVERYLGFNINENCTLMVFSDASATAYAAVAYIVSGDEGRNRQSRLLMSKARVNPLKAMSVPRLELMGALIAARMVKFIRSALSFRGRSILWIDSTCVLQWIKSNKIKGQFVSNRLKEIRHVPELAFKYVPTGENPADRASRGTSPAMLNEIWWKGPSWLAKDESTWPAGKGDATEESVIAEEGQNEKKAEEVKEAAEVVSTPFGIHPERYSTWGKLLRITAMCLRFTGLLVKNSKESRNSTAATERKFACFLWIKYEQTSKFGELKMAIKRSRPHHLKRSLGAAADKDGIIRCYGRLGKMSETHETKYPALLPTKSVVTDMIITECHALVCHAKTGPTLTTVRKSYWIPKGRARVKAVISRCPVCRRYDGGPYARPLMPELPYPRVNRTRPFSNIGLDYLGPLFVRSTEDGALRKRWICMFTCMTVRAIHLEVVYDLSAEAFALAVQRFISRRGKPDAIVCDNASQFRAVRSTDPFTRFTAGKPITWHFIPQLAPWAGGVYERLIKIIKDAMKKAIGRKILTHDQLVTVATEVELVVNSRPLTYVNDDVDDYKVLCPNDLLGVEGPIGVEPEICEEDADYGKTMHGTRVQLVQSYKARLKLVDEMWKLWRNDYLLSLRQRMIWQHKDPTKRVRQAPCVDDVVLVKDPALPRSRWTHGRIRKLLTGSGGVIRAVELSLPNRNRIVRPVNLLYPLECGQSRKTEKEADEQQEGTAEAQSECQSGRTPRHAALKAREKISDIVKAENKDDVI